MNRSEYIQEEIDVLKAKLLIFQSKSNDSRLSAEARALFGAKARKTQFKISQLSSLTCNSETPRADSTTRRRKSDGHS
jgi:hypothetical protein